MQLIFLLILGASLNAATRYIDYDAGSDSNNGTSTSTPWKRAPGMVGCTATCASFTPAPGDQIVLKGGVTWPSAALSWLIPWIGTAGSPITVTSDLTWFTGAAWTRPKLDAEYLVDKIILVDTGATYLRIERLELRRHIMTTAAGGSSTIYMRGSATGNVVFSDLYVHEWKRCLGSGNPAATCTAAITDNSGSGGGIYSRIGSGATMTGVTVERSRIGNPENGGDIGACLFGIEIVQYNVVHDCTQGLLHGGRIVRDNVFLRIGNTFDGTTHTNVIYADQHNNSGTNALLAAGTVVQIDNNEIRDCVATPGIYPNYGTSGIDSSAVYQIRRNFVYSNTNTTPVLVDPYLAASGYQATFTIENNTFSQPNLTQPLIRFVVRASTPAASQVTVTGNKLIGGNPSYRTDYGGAAAVTETSNTIMTLEEGAADGNGALAITNSATSRKISFGTDPRVNRGLKMRVYFGNPTIDEARWCEALAVVNCWQDRAPQGASIDLTGMTKYQIRWLDFTDSEIYRGPTRDL